MKISPATLKQWFISTFVLGQLRPNWPKDSFLRQFLRRLDCDCVLDVGANRGQYGKQLRLLGFRGLILSFEPDPEAFVQLSSSVDKDDAWFAFNLALGSEKGSGQLNIMANSPLNSFRRPTECETDIFKEYNKIIGSKTVPVETLDRMLPELSERFGFSRPFLKMDTQGFDLEVFHGSRGVIERVVGMQSELPILRIYEDMPSMQEAIHEYRSSGFEVVGLYPANSWDNPVIECDFYFARPDRVS